MSAVAGSWISSTFSAFRSPEREKLNEPTNETSSATTTFACMKSCTPSGDHGVDGLPENPALSTIVCEERDLPGAHAVSAPLAQDVVDLCVVDDADDAAARPR